MESIKSHEKYIKLSSTLTNFAGILPGFNNVLMETQYSGDSMLHNT